MVQVKEDLTGKVFGRLTVIKQVEDYIHPNGSRRACWLCECSCIEHTQIIVTGDNLKKVKGTRSCGCLQRASLDVIHKNKRKTNTYDLSKDYGIGWTSNTNKEFYFDLEDYDTIKDYCWFECVSKNGYHSLCTHDKETHATIRMSWLLCGKKYDHKNRNPLDNRKNNLRPATIEENSQNRSKRSDNTSGIIGVNWNKDKQLWVVRISVHKKRIWVGAFPNKLDAIKARLIAELKYFGEFAPQRHLFEEYHIDVKQEDTNE